MKNTNPKGEELSAPHAPLRSDDWYLPGDNGTPVAYKRLNEKPVFFDKEKALEKMSDLICDQLKQLRSYRDRTNTIFIGLYYGYPVCCIKEFVQDLENGINVRAERNLPGNITGFIPCRKHTQEILDGKITFESLISNRECHLPFDRAEQPLFRYTQK